MFNLAMMKSLRKHRNKIIGLAVLVVIAILKACS